MTARLGRVSAKKARVNLRVNPSNKLELHHDLPPPSLHPKQALPGLYESHLQDQRLNQVSIGGWNRRVELEMQTRLSGHSHGNDTPGHNDLAGRHI